MSLGMETSCTEQGSSALADLRIENARLRIMLDTAESVAMRYNTLLREGNHRIKNSLQIVTSLMSAQARREDNVSVRQALRAAASRIQSVAKMHDALQAGDGEDRVDLGALLETMCGSLQAMGGDELSVAVRVEADLVLAPVAFAQPLVLAVNELVVNALRHAFPDGRVGSVSIRLKSGGGQLRVVVADDGVGLPPGHADGKGYGMKLVRMMAKQLDGVLYVDSGAGTRISIVLPEPQPGPQPGPQPVRGPERAPANSRPLRLDRVRDVLTLLPRRPWNASGRG